MMQNSDHPVHEPNAAPPRAGRLLQGLLIVAMLVLIVVALVSFR